MKQVTCPHCKKIICEDADKLDETQRYVQCPYCKEFLLNIYYKEDGNSR